MPTIYRDVFISCLDSHSDDTHSLAENPLVSKWCNATFLFRWRNKHIYILDGLSETNKSIHNTNARKWPHISVIIDRLCGDISLYNISSVVTHRYICICGWLTGMMAYLTRRLSMNLGRPALNTNLICCCSHLSLHIIVNLPIQERLCFYTSNQSLGTGSLDYLLF